MFFFWTSYRTWYTANTCKPMGHHCRGHFVLRKYLCIVGAERLRVHYATCLWIEIVCLSREWGRIGATFVGGGMLCFAAHIYNAVTDGLEGRRTTRQGWTKDQFPRQAATSKAEESAE